MGRGFCGVWVASPQPPLMLQGSYRRVDLYRFFEAPIKRFAQVEKKLFRPRSYVPKSFLKARIYPDGVIFRNRYQKLVFRGMLKICVGKARQLLGFSLRILAFLRGGGSF